MSASLALLVQNLRDFLGDTKQTPTFTDAQLTLFINQGIKELSIHFPRAVAYDINTIAGQRVYDMAATHLAVLSVQYDRDNQPAPLFMKRRAYTHARFFCEDGYYDFVKPMDAAVTNPPKLYISTKPAAANLVIATRVTAEHNPLAQQGDQCTIPERALPVLFQFVRWQAWQELAVNEGMYPGPLATLSYSQEMNAGRAERAYRASLKEVQRAESDSAIANWGAIDKHDRAY